MEAQQKSLDCCLMSVAPSWGQRLERSGEEHFPVIGATSRCSAYAGYYLSVAQFPHLEMEIVGLWGELHSAPCAR